MGESSVELTCLGYKSEDEENIYVGYTKFKTFVASEVTKDYGIEIDKFNYDRSSTIYDSETDGGFEDYDETLERSRTVKFIGINWREKPLECSDVGDGTLVGDFTLFSIFSVTIGKKRPGSYDSSNETYNGKYLVRIRKDKLISKMEYFGVNLDVEAYDRIDLADLKKLPLNELFPKIRDKYGIYYVSPSCNKNYILADRIYALIGEIGDSIFTCDKRLICAVSMWFSDSKPEEAGVDSSSIWRSTDYTSSLLQSKIVYCAAYVYLQNLVPHSLTDLHDCYSILKSRQIDGDLFMSTYFCDLPFGYGIFPYYEWCSLKFPLDSYDYEVHFTNGISVYGLAVCKKFYVYVTLKDSRNYIQLCLSDMSFLRSSCCFATTGHFVVDVLQTYCFDRVNFFKFLFHTWKKVNYIIESMDALHDEDSVSLYWYKMKDHILKYSLHCLPGLDIYLIDMHTGNYRNVFRAILPRLLVLYHRGYITPGTYLATKGGVFCCYVCH